MEFSSIKIYAYLSAVWTDITADVLMSGNISVSYGIRGKGPTDILADVGRMTFRLSNRTGKYYPDNASPLAGWGYGTRVKLVLQYSESANEYTKFHGRVGKLDFQVGETVNSDYVTVTAFDWMHEAQKYPLLAPSIETSKTADYGIDAIVDLMPIAPEATSLDTGDNTFLTIFDSAGLKTTAYAEIAKLVNSEWGYCYITQSATTGETLVFENSSHRGASHPVKSIPSIDDNLLLETGDKLLLENGWGLLLQTTAEAELSGGMNGLRVTYGSGIVNHLTVTAYPKRIDIENQILYQLDNPIFIAAGDTVTFRAGYKDQTGGGAKVSAIVSSMLTPEVPGATDTTLKTLLHFNSSASDTTTNHTWDQNDVSISNDLYQDGFGIVRVSSNILGPFGVFGGYSNYKITAPTSDDWDLGSGAFTIGWYEARVNVVDARSTLATDGSASFPALLLGKLNTGTRKMEIYMSSSGTGWDIANARSLGDAKASKWTHYEVSRDSDGWFYAFSDGKLTDKWYSALSLYSTTNDLSIGYAQSNYTYMTLDEFYWYKGKCLHKTDFTPPRLNLSTTLPGDYLFNSASDGTGTDISSDLGITATYDSAGVTYQLTNNGAGDGYVTYLTARGLGVYQYNPIENSADSASSQAAYGFQSIYLQQRQQQNTEAGLTKAGVVVTNESDPLTEVEAVSIYGNYSFKNMQFFLLCDVGDLIKISHTPSGTSSQPYFINSVDFTMSEKFALATYGLRKNFAT